VLVRSLPLRFRVDRGNLGAVEGLTRITIILQAFPEKRFARFATDFDRIAASFRAAPR
jgi:hypothetical protein